MVTRRQPEDEEESGSGRGERRGRLGGQRGREKRRTACDCEERRHQRQVGEGGRHIATRLGVWGLK